MSLTHRARNIINSITRSAFNRSKTCWLESVIRKWVRFFFLSLAKQAIFCFTVGRLRSIYPEAIYFSYIFCVVFSFFRFLRGVTWTGGSRAFRKWSTRSAGTLLVIYSLFTYIYTFGTHRPVEKLNMWSTCNYSELWSALCDVRWFYAAVFRGTGALWTESILSQISRIREKKI